MQRRLATLILRAAATVLATAGALVCVFGLPKFAEAIVAIRPDLSFWQYPVLVGLYLTAACFFYVIFQFWRMLNAIDGDALPPQKCMKAIRVGSIVFGILYFVFAMPVIFMLADADDAPGAILIGVAMEIFPIGSAAVIAILEPIVKAAMPRMGERKSHTNGA